MSVPAQAWLLATWAWPLALLLACTQPAVLRVMPRLLALAPVPALAAALLAAGAPRLSIGGRPLELLFALDAPGALLLGVAALLWIADRRMAGYTATAFSIRSRTSSASSCARPISSPVTAGTSLLFCFPT